MRQFFRKNSKHKRVFLYGTKEELQLIGDIVFGDERVPYSGPLASDAPRSGDRKGVENWSDAEQLTSTLSERLSIDAIPREFVSYDGMRALGSGLQNLLSLKDWIDFLALRLEQQGVELITYVSLWENTEVQKEVFRNEISGAGNLDRLRKKKIRKLTGTKAPAKIIHRGNLINRDFSSKHVNSRDGIRKSIPEVESGWAQSFHFFGASEVYGAHLNDDETVPSYVSSHVAGQGIRILNHGMGGVNFIDVIARALSANYKRGDVVFLALPFTGESMADVEMYLDSECFFDSYHLNPAGAAQVAEGLVERQKTFQKPDRSFDDGTMQKADEVMKVYKQAILDIESNEFRGSELESYCAYLESEMAKLDLGKDNAVFGSVAVNCNPITKGHLALIEFAAKQVDILFVLVIEEDKSAVSFEDRFNMVEAVCSDYDNIRVLKGGHFVCTEYIAPEYFVKDEEQPDEIDFSLESFYFGNYIAPGLSITKIFLGEEPTCGVTQQYNDHMVETMPGYGIELTIIPRVANGEGVPISASRVRKLIKEDNWDAVQEIVPERAFAYMQKTPILR